MPYDLCSHIVYHATCRSDLSAFSRLPILLRTMKRYGERFSKSKVQRSFSSPGILLRRAWSTATTRHTFPSRISRQVCLALVMYFVIFLYATAFWIQIGAMAYLSKKLGADPVLFGYMETVFAVVMLLGGPLFGRFGDIFGSKAALLLAFLSSFLTYLILAFADDISALFFSRLFAFMMHAMHGAQMVLTDISGSMDRADALGKLGVAYGVGMVVGPAIGGYVTVMMSEQFAAGVAAGLCLLAMIIVLVCVPKSTKEHRTNDNRDSYNSGGVLNIRAIFSLLSIPAVKFVVVLKTVMGVPAGVFHTMMSVINVDTFDLSPDTNGKLLSYIGLITVVMQGCVVGYVGKRVSDHTSVIGGIILLTLSYLVLTLISTLPQFCVVVVPFIMAGTLLNTISDSVITKAVPESATGTSLGLSMATHSLIRTISPTLGGYLYQWMGYRAIGALGFVTGAITTGAVLGKGGIPGLKS